jgi:seryl-tRNA synthetase
LPKFESDLIKTNLKDFYLSPTGEVQLGQLQTLGKFSTFSNCYRAEASYGKKSKGLIRTFEFEK